jgi:hypothetical protein
MAAIRWGLGMCKILGFLLTALLLGGSFSARATTYTYTGLPLTQVCNFGCPGGLPNLTGSVTFDFDTSNFSGSLFLVNGDTAFLNGGSSGFTFPALFNPPPGTFGVGTRLNGQFTLVNGSITFWSMMGSTFVQQCIGPSCVYGTSGASTSPLEDSYDFFDSSAREFMFTNSGGGTWTEQFVASGIPEASTWAMMLIGFAGLGFAYNRRAVRAVYR